MDERRREAAQHVVYLHDLLAPMERRLRRTDALYAVCAVFTVACVAFATFTAGGLEAVVYALVAAVVGFTAGVWAMRTRARRNAFRTLEQTSEAAALDLQYHDEGESA
jgi:Flp pilus assembly protein TadB